MTEEVRRGPGRPRATTREYIETTTIDYLSAHGYANTTFAELAVACGVSRSTLTRHFPSKAAVAEAGFVNHLERLRVALEARRSEPDVVDAVAAAIYEAFTRSVDPDGLWWKRFRVLDESLRLRSEESALWVRWRRTVATFVADRTGHHVDDIGPAAFAGAIQAGYLALMRVVTASEAATEHAPDVPAELARLSTKARALLDED